jgi:hypothetical protein
MGAAMDIVSHILLRESANGPFYRQKLFGIGASGSFLGKQIILNFKKIWYHKQYE